MLLHVAIVATCSAETRTLAPQRTSEALVFAAVLLVTISHYRLIVPLPTVVALVGLGSDTLMRFQVLSQLSNSGKLSPKTRRVALVVRDVGAHPQEVCRQHELLCRRLVAFWTRM